MAALLEVSPASSARTFDLVGELDLSTVAVAERALRTATEDPGDLTLSLSRLRFVDSAGLHLFVRLAEGIQGSLILSEVPATIRKLFQVSGLENHPSIVLQHGAPEPDAPR
jgi:anti-anti-sigma factor